MVGNRVSPDAAGHAGPLSVYRVMGGKVRRHTEFPLETDQRAIIHASSAG
jgi:hypothetical protein